MQHFHIGVAGERLKTGDAVVVREGKVYKAIPKPKTIFDGMGRWELVNEMRKYAHPQQYHAIIKWPNEQLRDMMEHYLEMRKLGIEMGFGGGYPMGGIVIIKFESITATIHEKRN